MSNPLTPPARVIDPRGQRFAAGLSAVLLGAALVVNAPVVILLVALAMATSAAFGTQYWLLGKPWPVIRRSLRLGPTEPEHEYPPRFAQALGTIFLGLGLVVLAVGPAALGWLLAGAVIALQTLLATTGYCVGCKLYFLRWWVPSLFARLVGRGAPAGVSLRAPQR